MSRLIFLSIFLLAATNRSALAYPPQVKIHYDNGRGNAFFATADVTEEKSAEIPVNGESVISIKIYKLSFRGPDGVSRSAYTTDSFLNDYEKLKAYQEKNPGELLRVPRTTGGFSPGTMKTPLLKVVYAENGAGRLVTGVGADIAFKDFDRVGTSHGDPMKTITGDFSSAGYSKRVAITGWNEDGSPRIHGSDGKYTFPDLNRLDMRKQRFLLDFGKHPYDREKQLLYPVYVDHYEGDNAIIIAPHELQKVERAQKGEKIKVSYWTVPKNYLRIAPEDDAGNALLQQARLQFVEDERQVAERGAPIETIIRANRHNPDAIVEVTAGSDIEESMMSLRKSISQQKNAQGNSNDAKGCGGAYDASS